jgi:tubulin-specific chaperone D
VIFLCHRFPRVRAVTAEQMYETIQLAQEEDGFPDSDLDAVLNLLSETNWTDDSVDVIRPIRNEICDMLKIPKPKAVQKKPAA